MTTSEFENNQTNPVRHDEVDAYTRSPSADNPVSDSFNIVVSVPESIQIKMVDASALADYEIWVFIASLLSNAVVGFLVAYFQAIDSKSVSATYIGWTTMMFTALFVLATATAIYKRTFLKRKGRDIRLKTSGATTSNK